MEALGGFLVGYLLGTRAGKEGLTELVQSWQTIRESEEFQGLVGMAGSVLGGAVSAATSRGRSSMSDRVVESLVDQAREALTRKVGSRVA